ncbi:MAG: hypothetical protein IPJ85_12380 [Flavobacteriales bacterium]|nr:hypothetical protein [Flavobacteriales bacterium]
MTMRSFAAAIAFMALLPIKAQDMTIDSLRNDLHGATVSGSIADTAIAARYAAFTRAFLRNGELDSAAARAHEALGFIQRATSGAMEHRPWLRQLMVMHKLKGIADFYAGRYDAALVSMHDYQRIANKLGSVADEGAAFNYMSYCFRSMQDPEQAKVHARAAIQVLSTLPPGQDLADSYTGLASAFADEDATDSAQQYNRSALAIYERIGHIANATNTWLNMADTWARIDAHDSCSAALSKAREGLASASADAWLKYQAHSGRLHLVHGALASAQTALDSALQLAEEQGSAEALAHVGGLLALTAAARGDFARAIALHRSANDAMIEDLDLDKARALTEARLRHEQENERAAALLESARQQARMRAAIITGTAAMLAAVLILALYINVRRSRAAIRKERDRNEELLLNILPAEVAQELKEKGEAEARLIDQATILFSDFMGFTGVSEQLSPQELVEELNVCFKAFDGIITARGIEKIKTIGDAYMAAGGLPAPRASAPSDVVLAALEMQGFMQERKRIREAQGKPVFPMRVGIHTGPVVAGIVGVKKFQYDIWGDTVNIAARMESSGEPGQVNISEATHDLVRNETGLTFAPRGKVQAKGKGELEMFFVERHG